VTRHQFSVDKRAESRSYSRREYRREYEGDPERIIKKQGEIRADRQQFPVSEIGKVPNPVQE
jgi:hypothetical protein